jgi:ADP-dependent NAD(P)H-hydrate dehydratase / NAD(P)H-hydrate epimerase
MPSDATPDAVLLRVDEMYQADRAAMDAGVPGLDLMEAAGTAIAREIRRRWRPRPTVVLAGPGNNGGDGFVVARLLADRGWPIRIGLLGSIDHLGGDAAVNARRWLDRPGATVLPVADDLIDGSPLIVDALFGAGLVRAIEGLPAVLLDAINARDLDCVAVDVPSGVDGNTGEVRGTAPRCRLTVTFFRGKPGHWLLPGRDLCGDLVVADIGIPDAVLANIAPQLTLTDPVVWRDQFRWPSAAGNKYGRGHCVVSSGPMTGASRLSAEAARRTGAGLVTMAVAPEDRAICASGPPGTIVTTVSDDDAFTDYLADPRRNAVLIGPGAGTTSSTRTRTLAALALRKSCVLDADALTVFREDPATLFAALHERSVLTPHDGEFARLFDAAPDKLARTRAAAGASGAVVLLKGFDTVVAAPDGRAAINRTAPPELATGGTGDVLAGILLGLLAQGMPTFEAACAAAWLHGTAATTVGPGLIAEDVVDALPSVLEALRRETGGGN